MKQKTVNIINGSEVKQQVFISAFKALNKQCIKHLEMRIMNNTLLDKIKHDLKIIYQNEM